VPCRAFGGCSRRLVLGVVVCGLALGTVLGTSGIATAATTPPRKELLRAINKARSAFGAAKLMGSSALRLAALRHSEDMLARHYFAHTSPTGSTVAHRIQRSGFVYGYSWQAGETIAWGIGSHAGAAATVAAWLKSPVHRAILLSRTFHWVGIGRNCGRFIGHPNSCVWTADFVMRR
jgi:uncharacterized protein YkwD